MNVSIKVEVYNGEDLQSSFSVSNHELIPGGNVSIGFDYLLTYCKDGTAFLPPAVYNLKVTVFNAEFTNILAQQVLPYRINMGFINSISPIGNVESNLPVSFCFSQLSAMSFINAQVYIWEALMYESKDLLNAERPPYATFSATDFCNDYPIASLPLQEGKEYDFQIVVHQGTQLIARSKVNRFSIRKKGDETVTDYRLLSHDINNNQYVYGNKIKFAFDNRFSEEQLNYSIKDITAGKGVKSPPVIRLRKNMNYIEIDMDNLPGLRPGNSYLLMVKNAHGENYNIQFDYKPQNK